MQQHHDWIDDELWGSIAPLLPVPPCNRRGGRPRRSDRAVLEGILYVLRTRCAWGELPDGLGYGSGTTCWRRLQEWQRAGMWTQIQRVLYEWLQRAGEESDWLFAGLGEEGGARRRARRRQVARDVVASQGHKGGTTTRDRYGSEYYRQIGAVGGAAVREKWGIERFRELGRAGGAARRGGHFGAQIRRRRAAEPAAGDSAGDVAGEQ